jgi:hypothetical protein
MKENIEGAIIHVGNSDDVLLIYEDPDKESPYCVGGGQLVIYSTKSKGEPYKVNLSLSAREAQDALRLILMASINYCACVYVEDLHHYMMRLGDRIFKIENPIISEKANVIDLSYAKSWAGLDTDFTVMDVISSMDSNVLKGAEILSKKISKRGKWYYYNYYLEIMHNYCMIENSPVDIWDVERNTYVKRWVQYEFHSTKTGRLVSKGSCDMSKKCINFHFMKREERPNYVKARINEKIIYVDCKAAEISLAACLSNDENLMNVFERGEDPYSKIALKFPYGSCDRGQVKKIMISSFVYGASVSRMVEDTGLDHDLVREIIQYCRNSFPDLDMWISQITSIIREKGFVVTPTGMKIKVVAEKARIVGPNNLIQSLNSHINIAMYSRIVKECFENFKRIKPIIHIHDGYVFRVPFETADEDEEILCELVSQVPFDIKELENLKILVESTQSDTWR